MLIGLITAPRPENTSYLRSTVHSLLTAGAGEIHVFAEPRSEKCEDITWHHQNTQTLGNFRNWFCCALYMTALAKWSQETRVIIGEDDAIYEKNAIDEANRIMDGFADKDIGYLALFTNSFYKTRMTQDVQSFPFRSKNGAVSLCFQVKSLEKILDAKIMQTWSGLADVDVCLSKACEDLGLPVFLLKNNLAQHVGRVSSLGRPPSSADCLG